MIPPAARATHTLHADYSKTYQKKLTDLRKLFAYAPGVIGPLAQACNLRTLELEFTPLEQPIACDWTEEEMEDLYATLQCEPLRNDFRGAVEEDGRGGSLCLRGDTKTKSTR